MRCFGNKKEFAIEIGKYWEDSKQHQDIRTWLDKRHLTEMDSIVYLPTYYANVVKEIEKLEKNDFYRKYFENISDRQAYDLIHDKDDIPFKILCFDLTTYPAYCYLFNNGIEDRVVYSFWDPRHKPSNEIDKVFGIAINRDFIIKVLTGTLNHLSTDWF